MPRISIILPVYNVEPYLDKCIQSILNQTFTDFDLIIVESASTDNSGKICEKYAKLDNRITLIHEKERGGLSKGRNVGIDWAFNNSDSEWIAFIDSDDWIHKRYFELLYNCALQNKVNVIRCNHQNVTEYIPDQDILHLKFLINSPEELFVNHGLNIYTSWEGIYKKELFTSLRYPTSHFVSEDAYVIPLVFFSQQKICFVEEKLYYYRLNEDGLSNIKITPKIIDDMMGAHVVLLNYFGKNDYIKSFNLQLLKFKNYYSLRLREYGADQKYIKVFKTFYTYAKDLIDQFDSIIQDKTKNEYKKSGLKKWFMGQIDENNRIDTEAWQICLEKSKLHALLWKIKERIKSNLFFLKINI